MRGQTWGCQLETRYVHMRKGGCEHACVPECAQSMCGGVLHVHRCVREHRCSVGRGVCSS